MKLTCYEALNLASKCVRSARKLRELDVVAATRLLFNATLYVEYAETRRAQAPHLISSISRVLRGLDAEVDYHCDKVADFLESAPGVRAEA
jgi:hypothetical protein